MPWLSTSLQCHTTLCPCPSQCRSSTGTLRAASGLAICPKRVSVRGSDRPRCQHSRNLLLPMPSPLAVATEPWLRLVFSTFGEHALEPARWRTRQPLLTHTFVLPPRQAPSRNSRCTRTSTLVALSSALLPLSKRRGPFNSTAPSLTDQLCEYLRVVIQYFT